MKVTKIYCKNCGYMETGYYGGKGTPLMINVPANHIKGHKCKKEKTEIKTHSMEELTK